MFEAERDRVFAAGWFCVGRTESVSARGDFRTVEVAGEPIVLVRGAGGELRGFANTCRHRGTRLLDGTGRLKGAIVCPYHSWTYGLDGALLATPNVRADDDLERGRLRLSSVRLESWDGFAFVNLDAAAPPLETFLAAHPDDLLQLARYGVGRLRVGATRTYDVAANWKIVVENYHECLHCPGVHPELVQLMPLYRRGEVEEEGQTLGNTMGAGLTSFTRTGTSELPTLPGLTEEDVRTFYGVYLFPNLILNFHSDTVNVVTLNPTGPDRTTVVSEFLFEPSTIAATTFDPSDVVGFRDLVARQDWAVCERAQRGVRSRSYRHGVYPRQERYVADFNRRYLAVRGPLG